MLSIRIAKILIINVCFFISSFIPVILNQRKGEKEKKKLKKKREKERKKKRDERGRRENEKKFRKAINNAGKEYKKIDVEEKERKRKQGVILVTFLVQNNAKHCFPHYNGINKIK